MSPAKPTGPLPYRIWAVLHWLDDEKHKRYPRDYLKLSDIMHYIHGNHPSTRALIDFMIDKGLVTREPDDTYRITQKGSEMLPIYTQAFDSLYHEFMEPLRERMR